MWCDFLKQANHGGVKGVVTEKDKASLLDGIDVTINQAKERDLNDMPLDDDASDVEPDDDDFQDHSEKFISKRRQLNKSIESEKDTSIALDEEAMVLLYSFFSFYCSDFRCRHLCV